MSSSEAEKNGIWVQPVLYRQQDIVLPARHGGALAAPMHT